MILLKDLIYHKHIKQNNMKNFKELEVGKTYRAENGCTGVAEKDYCNNMFSFKIRWDDGKLHSYKIDGYVYSDNREHPYNVAKCLDLETPESIQAEKPLKEQFESKTVGGYEVDLWKKVKSGNIIGSILVNGDEVGVDWGKNGKCYIDKYSLIPIKPKPIKLSGFMNVYDWGASKHIYTTKEEANSNATENRICVIDLSKIGEEAIIR